MLCLECKRLEAARIVSIRHYKGLMAARRDVLQDGRPVSPTLAAALVRAETAVGEAIKAVDEHAATHSSARQSV